LLRQRLGKRAGVTIKPLTLDPLKPEVPNDCTVLMIPGPRVPYSPAQIDAIGRFLEPPTEEQRKARQDAAGTDRGKLLIFFDVAPDPVNRQNMVQTGLEPLVARYNVTATNNRPLTVTGQVTLGNRFAPPDRAMADPAPGIQRSTNPRARVVISLERLVVNNPRELRAGGNNPQYLAEPLMTTPRSLICWPESNLTANTVQLDEDVHKA